MEGRGPAPSLVLHLIYWLPEASLTAALMRGGREHYGWTHERYLLAALYDAQNVNTQASGHWAKKPPKFEPWPRPGELKAEKKKTSVAELYKRIK